MIYTIQILKDRINQHYLKLNKLETSDPESMSSYEFASNEIINHKIHIKELQEAIKKLIS